MPIFVRDSKKNQGAEPVNSPKPDAEPFGRRHTLHSAHQSQQNADAKKKEQLPESNIQGCEAQSSNRTAVRFAHDFSEIPTNGRNHEQASDPIVVPNSHISIPGRDRFRSSVRSQTGEPLTDASRGCLEAILSTRLGDVRLHRGAAAERASAAIGAEAFTVGQDITLSAGAESKIRTADCVSPQRMTDMAGMRILAHEAAHTIQQSGGGQPAGSLLSGFSIPVRQRAIAGGPEERQAEAAAQGLERPKPGMRIAVAMAPRNAPTIAPVRQFKDIWPEFVRAQYSLNLTKATMLARQLATAPHDFADILNHGIEVVSWLQHNGEPALAAKMLSDVRSVWMIQFVSNNAVLPLFGSLTTFSNNPDQLISLGKKAARAGKDKQAFQFFGVANEILSYYALEMSRKRTQEFEKENDKLAGTSAGARQAMEQAIAAPHMFTRSSQYSDLKGIYDQMREIYGFYSVLEREAIDAGDAKAASAARTKAGELHKELKDKYTWGSMQKAGGITQDISEPVEIAEVGLKDTPKGPGLTLYGANDAETTLTQLPGLPSPKEIGNNVQIQNLATLQHALMAQTDFQAEIGRQPEIRKEFGKKAINLTEPKERYKVWRIMYGIYKRSGPGALGALMSLIGRYLKAFTVHTMYNVRDWGKSYLDSKMPTDLAGRTEQDCGVYALTVAWDVYQTVKQGDPKLNVTFDLVTMLEHVSLVITDKSTGEFYVVNNDQVSPPQKGDPLKLIGPQYGAIRGLPYTVGPAVTVHLGSTKDPQKKFHDEAWTRYLASVDWGLRLDIPKEVEKLKTTDPAAYSQKVREIRQNRYKTFYRNQEIFDSNAKKLDPMVDALAPVANDAKKLASALNPVVDKAGDLAVLFIGLGPAAGIVAGSARSQKILPRQAQFLFSMQKGHTVHPIARVALAILHLKALGGTPTPKEDALIKFCLTVPLFKQQMADYQASGAMGKF